eukprot:13355239-Heterocapsa_arctica.AAC.1
MSERSQWLGPSEMLLLPSTRSKGKQIQRRAAVCQWLPTVCEPSSCTFHVANAGNAPKSSTWPRFCFRG